MEKKLLRSIRRACTTYFGQDKLWEDLRNKGATDKDIRRMLKRTITSSGGVGGPDIYFTSHKGNPPRIWIRNSGWGGEADYKGSSLVEIVREAWGIPRLQPRLFE